MKFLGFVDLETLAALYKQALAMVFPTFFGPDNLPPLEAFALGCPVIASDYSGSEEQLGDAVLSFAPTDERGLAEHILRLSGDETLRKELTAKGKERAELSTPDTFIRGIFDILSEFELIRRCWSDKDRYVHL